MIQLGFLRYIELFCVRFTFFSLRAKPAEVAVRPSDLLVVSEVRLSFVDGDRYAGVPLHFADQRDFIRAFLGANLLPMTQESDIVDTCGVRAL